MRTALLSLACAAALAAGVAHAANKLYRHVDEKGNVTYTDRPPQAGQQAEKTKPPNVASPEARRQMEMEREAALRRQQAERAAQQRRAMADRLQQQQEQYRPPRYGRYDPNLPDSQPPSDTSRRSY